MKLLVSSIGDLQQTCIDAAGRPSGDATELGGGTLILTGGTPTRSVSWQVDPGVLANGRERRRSGPVDRVALPNGGAPPAPAGQIKGARCLHRAR